LHNYKKSSTFAPPKRGGKVNKKAIGISRLVMQLTKHIKGIVCVFLTIVGIGATPVYGYMSPSSNAWGNSSYVNDYYYGERKAFQQQENMFNYGATATWDMQSTSTEIYTAATFSTAASNITAGMTLADYNEDYVERRTGIRKNGWAPPTTAPIGDGWDVILFLLALAAGYGIIVYKQHKLTKTNN